METEGEGAPTGEGDDESSSQPGTGSPEQKFTQADLDKIAGSARETGRKAAEKQLLEALGVPDLDQAKAALAAAREAEEAGKTELQKAQERAAELERKAAEAEATALQVRLDAALEGSLRDGGIKPERVAAAMRLADRSALSVEDGQVKGLSEVIEALKAESPEWFGATVKAPDATGGTTTGSSERESLSPKELRDRLSKYGVHVRV